MSIDAGVVREVATRVTLTEEQVKMVLDAWTSVREGPAPGTVLINDASGTVAVRVSQDGLQFWFVVALEGSFYKDMQPTLAGWNTIKSA